MRAVVMQDGEGVSCWVGWAVAMDGYGWDALFLFFFCIIWRGSPSAGGSAGGELGVPG